MQESPEIDKIFVANLNNMHWILLININPLDAEYKQRLEQEWFVYDNYSHISLSFMSLNITIKCDILMSSSDCTKINAGSFTN
ncbi:hypothetical protein BpHYR1_018153 [Brachionus plicatilis]|uniref:Uncharacterized protein n=1 Tax=Brachionus plicatilis TaxID=10195 RepID=A0A3M7QC49_BRAPC|nr:hypothetical protein BpHYR1_018153 [Brachionus plicatilis]